MRVLDIAAGTGDSSLIAAQKVGPHGSVLATDISQTMLNVAADLAREAGLSNLETLVGDATRLELPEVNFDAAICRFGLMFMPDLQAVLTRVCRALKPGARFAALVWSTDAQNPWISVQLDVVREMERMPSSPPTLAQTTSLSAPGLLERALRSAEFQQVSLTPIATPRHYASLDEAWQMMQSSSPAHGELTREMNDAERERKRQQRELEKRRAEKPNVTTQLVPARSASPRPEIPGVQSGAPAPRTGIERMAEEDDSAFAPPPQTSQAASGIEARVKVNDRGDIEHKARTTLPKIAGSYKLPP